MQVFVRSAIFRLAWPSYATLLPEEAVNKRAELRLHK